MKAKTINEQLSVSDQLSVADLGEAAKAGFKSLICNRPDGEGPDQPPFAEIEKAAKIVGIEARYIPVISGQVLDTDADAFGNAMDALPKPVLAYCRTGNRSTSLWALYQSRSIMPLRAIPKAHARM